MELNTITMFCHDGDVELRLKRGGFHTDGKVITISVECEPEDPGDTWPPCALFCIEGFPIADKPVVDDVYVASGGVEEDVVKVPACWAYFSFHSSRNTQTWRVEALEGEAIVVNLVVLHEDVNSYDASAKETETRGLFRLQPTPLEELWVPS